MKKRVVGYLTYAVIMGILFGWGFFILPSIINDNQNPQDDDPDDPDDPPYWYYETNWEESNETHVFYASNVITVNNTTYSLNAHVSRDFMPIITDTGLQVSVSVTANNTFPSTMDYDMLWVKKSKEIFKSPFSWEERLSNRVNKGAYAGPGWPEGALIYIAVRLISDDNNTYYLKSGYYILDYTH